MSEMALVASKKYKLENAKNNGGLGAKKALSLSENLFDEVDTIKNFQF